MPGHIIVDDHDDRPQRMIRDPDRYFAEARQRAEQELRRNGSRWLPFLFRRRRH